MARRATPRPDHDGRPVPIRYDQAARHLWGDPASGEVADWVYASTTKIHQLLFALPPGGSFGHSPDNKTVFAADEVLYVLQGELVLANPETGEVHRVRTGEAAFFRRDTWHHGFAHGPDQLRVLELFAPPPATGSSSAYARTRPDLDRVRYTDDSVLGRWPMERDKITDAHTIRVLRDSDVLWRLEGELNPVLTGLLAATDQLTVGRVELPAGRRGDGEAHGGDETLYVLEGTLNVLLPDADAPSWFELHPGDGFYLPAGTRHQYYNMTGGSCSFLFGVAPDYRRPG